MDLKGHIIDQKGSKKYKKWQNVEFLDQNAVFLAEFPPPSLSGKGSVTQT